MCERLASDPTSIATWTLFYVFPFCILPAVPKDKRVRRSGLTQTQSIRERIRRWRAGECVQLWRESLKMTSLARRRNEARRKKNINEEEQKEFNARRAAMFVSEGEYSKAMQTLTSDGLVPATEDNLQLMSDLHPRCEPPTVLNTDEPQIQLSQSEVRKTIMLLRNGTSAGPCGFKPGHLKACISTAALARRDRTLAAICRLVNQVAAGRVPESIRHLFSSASLFGVPKRSGGLRPVAAGSLLRRITATTIARKLKDKAAALFRPLQVGIGIRNSCESIIHSVRLLVDSNPNIAILQTDFQSAFNLCSRNAMMEGVAEHFPEMLEFVKVTYGRESSLFFGEYELQSQVGVQQGDGLGVILFGLILHPIITEIKVKVPDLLLNSWMLDDGCLAADADRTADLGAALDIISDLGPARGLHLSTDLTVGEGRGKTSLWQPNTEAEAAPDLLGRGVKLIRAEGIKILGSAVGSRDYVNQFLSAAVEKVRRVTDMLPLLQDSQKQYVLLRSTLSIGKFWYLLRTTPCTEHSGVLREFDAVTRSALNDLLGTVLSNSSYLQATLPVSASGLGLRNSFDHSSAAYSASILSCLDLMLQLIGSEYVDRLSDEAAGRGGEAAGHVGEAGAGGEDDHDLEPAVGPAGGVGGGVGGEDDQDLGPEAGPDKAEVIAGLLITPAVLASLSEAAGEVISLADLLAGTNQKALSQKIDADRLSQLKQMFEDSPRDKARIAALSTPRSRDFLYAVPCREFHMRSEQFSVIVKYQMGANVYEDGDFTCPACHQPAGANGDHMLVCGGVGNGRIIRHNAIREVLISVAKQSGLSPVREPRFLLPGVDRRPADLMIRHWSRQGSDTLIDCVISSSLRQDTLSRYEAGTVGRLAHERKVQQVGGAVNRLNMEFLPFSLESLGTLTQTAINIVTKLGRDRAIRNGGDQDKSVNNAFKQISVTLQKCNSDMFLNKYYSLESYNIM